MNKSMTAPFMLGGINPNAAAQLSSALRSLCSCRPSLPALLLELTAEMLLTTLGHNIEQGASNSVVGCLLLVPRVRNVCA